MSFFIAGAIVVSSVYINQESKKSQKKAKKDAEEDAMEAEKQARKAETFAETEGNGIGELGKVSLEVDDEVDDDDISGVVRI